MQSDNDDGNKRDPYHDKMDWSQWHTYRPKPERPAKKEWRKTDRDPNYMPNDRRYRVKEMIWNDPDIGIEEIAKALGAPRTSQVSIAIIANEHRHTLRFLARQGIRGIRLGKIRQRNRGV